MVLGNVSPRVKKRFPTLGHYVEAGLMNDNEREIIEDLNVKFPKHSKHWWDQSGQRLEFIFKVLICLGSRLSGQRVSSHEPEKKEEFAMTSRWKQSLMS